MRTHLMAVAMMLLGGWAMGVHAGEAGQHRMNPELRKKLLEKFDKDGDGKLSEDERAAARAAFQAKHPEFKQKLLARFDKDGDGKLSESEREAAKAAFQAHRSQHTRGMKTSADAPNSTEPTTPTISL